MSLFHWGSKPAAPAPAAPAPAPAPAAPTVTAAALEAIHVRDAAAWAAALAPACAKYGIDTRQRLAAFLANCAHESALFTHLRESLVYSTAARIHGNWPSRFPTLASAQPCVNNPAKLAARVYGGRMGNLSDADALAFCGHGILQITGRAGHQEVAGAFGWTAETVAAWLLTPEGAALGAAWWWDKHGCNAAADTGDVAATRRIVNGGTLGLAEVRGFYGVLLPLL